MGRQMARCLAVSVLTGRGVVPLRGRGDPCVTSKLAKVCGCEWGPRGHVSRPLPGLECSNHGGDVITARLFCRANPAGGRLDCGLIVIHGMILAQSRCAC